MNLDELLITKLEGIPVEEWLCMGLTCSVPIERYRVVLDSMGYWLGHSSRPTYYISIFPREEPDVTRIYETDIEQEDPLYDRIKELYDEIVDNKNVRAGQLKEQFIQWLSKKR